LLARLQLPTDALYVYVLHLLHVSIARRSPPLHITLESLPLVIPVRAPQISMLRGKAKYPLMLRSADEEVLPSVCW
jgi:hypothetical protein